MNRQKKGAEAKEETHSLFISVTAEPTRFARDKASHYSLKPSDNTSVSLFSLYPCNPTIYLVQLKWKNPTSKITNCIQ